MKHMVVAFILWAISRERHPIPVVTHEDRRRILWRYQPFWPDEFVTKSGKHIDRPPWWRPFNILLHRWVASHREEMHDHPRWSVTICLRGKIIEHTPWGSRTLGPGGIVIRSRKYIHALELPEGMAGKTWTLFIVGRRNHAQNGFIVKPFAKLKETAHETS